MVLVAGAGPAWADPARPSNFVSEVVRVDPAGLPAEFRVVGGDSFLEVTVEPGHTAEIPGYQEEPYIRVEADGTVLVNDRSPTRWVNDDRYGLVTPPSDAAADAPPEWVEVATGGRYAWHDHRIHWMTPDQPPPVVQGEPVEVMEWTVPVVVDGEPAQVMGTLRWLPAVSPLPALGLGLLAAVPVLFVWRARPFLAGVIAVGAAGVAALVVAFSLLSVSPPGAGGEFLIWAPPALAVGGAVAAPLLRRRRPEIAELPVIGWCRSADRVGSAPAFDIVDAVVALGFAPGCRADPVGDDCRARRRRSRCFHIGTSADGPSRRALIASGAFCGPELSLWRARTLGSSTA